MTTAELADTYERLASGLRKIARTVGDGEVFPQKPIIHGDFAVGAAFLWSYLRDLFTAAGKDQFTRDELLVLLDTISRDGEIFVPGAMAMMADAWAEEEAAHDND
jgi:hypothetical protein